MSVVALVATACTAEAPAAPPPPTVAELTAFSPLDVPDELRPTGVRVGSAEVLGDTATLPVIVAGTRTTAGETPVAAVWTRAKDGSLPDEPIVLDTAGAVQALDLDGSTDLAAIGGYAWEGGVRTAFLFTSADRKSWTPVPLPDDVASASVSEVAVSGTDVVVAGRASGGSLVAAVSHDGADATPLELPETEYVSGVDALAIRAKTIVVAADAGAEGAPQTPVTLTSTDAGATWTTGVLGAEASVNGAGVLTNDTLVLTGSLDRDHFATSLEQSWSSADGSSWAEDETADLYLNTDGGDHWFSEPTVVEDNLLVPVAHSRAPVFNLLARSPKGSYDELAPISTQFDGFPANELGLDISASYLDGGDIWSLAAGHGGATLHGPGVKSKDTATLGDDTTWLTVDQQVDRRTDAPLTASRRVFEKLDDGWRTSTESAQFVVADDTLAAVPDQSQPPADSGAGAQDDESGTEVFLHTDWNTKKDAVVVTPWFRTDGGTWEQGSGFGSKGYAMVDTVTRVGERWVATGNTADETFDTDRAVAVWTSTDGEGWKSGGRLEGGKYSSGASAACALPDSGTLLVGSVEDVATSSLATWRTTDKGWEQTLHDTGASAFGSDCLETADATLVVATVGQGTQILSTTDGAQFTPVYSSHPGEWLSEITPVDGGFVAAGWSDAPAGSGPVLRFSHTGATWVDVPVPVTDAEQVHVVADGDSLVVLGAGGGGTEAWRVDDVPAILAAVPADEAPDAKTAEPTDDRTETD